MKKINLYSIIIFCLHFLSCQMSGQITDPYKTIKSKYPYFRLFKGHIDNRPAMLTIGTYPSEKVAFHYFLDEGRPLLERGTLQTRYNDTAIYFYEDAIKLFSKPVAPTLLKDGYEYRWLFLDSHVLREEKDYEYRGKFVNDSLYEGFLGSPKIPREQWKPFSFSLDIQTTDVKFEPISFEKEFPVDTVEDNNYMFLSFKAKSSC